MSELENGNKVAETSHNQTNIGDIVRTIGLICHKDQTYELRVVKAGKFGTISGYYRCDQKGAELMAKEAARLSGDPVNPAVYLTINPTDPDLIARASHKTKTGARETTQDADIKHRCTLLIDCDPTRKSGISSSEPEHQAAIAKGKQIKEYLTSIDWPEPLLASSGNGCHLVYRIDLPNNKESATLVKSVLDGLAEQFDDESVTVDRSVFNAARISKIYGTWTRKGDSIPERPHRVSRIISAPGKLQTVTAEQLHGVAKKPDDLKTTKEPSSVESSRQNAPGEAPGSYTAEDIERLLEAAQIEVLGREDTGDVMKWHITCPNASEHTTADGPKDSTIFLRNGILGYKCQHSHCVDWQIGDVLPLVKKCTLPEDLQKHLEKTVANATQTRKSTAGAAAKRYDKHAVDFVSSIAGRHPFSSNKETMYEYHGDHYELCHELEEDFRSYCRRNGIDQSNTLITNVLPIVINAVWKKGIELPCWDGPDCPFRSKSDVITFSNGLLDVSQPQIERIPLTPKWLSTFKPTFEYDPSAVCPEWMKFLESALADDQDSIDLLQEWFGYCLTQDISLQKCLVLYGITRAGKSTVQKILTALVGKENTTAFSLEKLATEFGLTPLVGKSLATISEVELSGNRDQSKITEQFKSIVGGDPVVINRKHAADMNSVRLGVRFCIATNAIPRLRDSTGALQARFLYIPFRHSFVGREDLGLEEKLLNELPGIANWALRGLARLRANGGKFTVGKSQNEAAQEHAADTSPVLQWLKDEVLLHDSLDNGLQPKSGLISTRHTTLKTDAYLSFSEWCIDKGVDACDTVWFGRTLKNLLPKLKEVKVPDVTGTLKRAYQGLSLRQM